MSASWKLTKMTWKFRAEKGKDGKLLTNEYCGANQSEFSIYRRQIGNQGIMEWVDTFEFDFGKERVLFSTTVGAKFTAVKVVTTAHRSASSFLHVTQSSWAQALAGI